jgi:ATP/maltotriose-dependent transcriptional regulator MalT
MPEVSDLLAAGRDSYTRRDWPGAYRAFSSIRQRRELDTDDLHALGDAAWWLGLIKETLIISEECYRRYLQEGRPLRAAMDALDAGFSWILRGESAIGSGWLSRARQLLADQPPCAEQAFLIWMDASEALAAGDLDAALVAARQVQEAGQQFASPSLTSLGLLSEGMVAIQRGQLKRGFGLLDEAMLPVLAGQVQPEWAGNIYCQMMAVCHDLADFNRARQWTTATQRWCEELSSAVMFLGICRMHRVQLLQLGGQWTRAEAEASVACTELAEMNLEVVAEAHYQRAELLRLKDDLPAADREYRRAEELGRNPQPGLALLHLAQGQVDQAAADLRAALAEVPAATAPRARLLVTQAEIALAEGDLATAIQADRELAEIADRFPTPGFTAWSHHTSGTIALAQDHVQEALDRLQAALQAYGELEAPYHAARVRVLMADAFDRLGDAKAAAAERDSAVAVFAQLGARHELRLLVNRRQPPYRAVGLTEREAEVLSQIAAGRTNKEVAATLVLSEKTVARHLANIYLKLGVTSRTAAASWAYRHGMVHPRADA